MVNLMEKKNYDLTQITRLLLEMRENCVPKDGEAYDDPKRMEKYDALNSAIDLINNPSLLVTGDTSDGYHTFNELYHHRAVLFSVIVKAFPGMAWKAKHHHDGTMYDGMFIVGIETPDGQATYHYDIEPYWDMFECKELEYAPEWDGHTPAQAIARIGKLEPVPVVRCKECVCSSRLDDQLVCSRISEVMYGYYHGTVDVVKPDDYCSHGIRETAKPIDVKMGAE